MLQKWAEVEFKELAYHPNQGEDSLGQPAAVTQL